MCHRVIHICHSQNYCTQHSRWPLGKAPTSFLSRTCRPTYQKIDGPTCPWLSMASDKLAEWHNSATICFAIRGTVASSPPLCVVEEQQQKQPISRRHCHKSWVLSSSACVRAWRAILGSAPYAPVPQRGKAGDFVSMIRYTASWHGALSCQGEELHSAVQ